MFGVPPDDDARSTLTRTKKPSAAVRLSAAEKGGSGVYPENNTTQHAHAHNKPSKVESRSGNESDFKQCKKV
jgi:hypothetical protein